MEAASDAPPARSGSEDGRGGAAALDLLEDISRQRPGRWWTSAAYFPPLVIYMDAHFCQAFKRCWVEGKDCSHTSGFLVRLSPLSLMESAE